MNSTWRFPAYNNKSALLEYKDQFFSQRSIYRCKWLREIVESHLFEQHRQWLEEDSNIYADGVRGYVWRDLPTQAQDGIPKPVLNIIPEAIDIECAALGKQEWTGRVFTISSDPRLVSVAKLNDNVLKAVLDKSNWDSVRQNWIRQDVVEGTGILKTYVDSLYLETELVASPEAVECLKCNWRAASPVLAADQTLPGMQVEENKEGQATLQRCPQCGAELSNFEPGHDLKNAADPFGRPFFVEIPKQQIKIDNVPSYEYFPGNLGLGHTPYDLRAHGQCSVKPIEWVEERYPALLDKLEPKNPAQLFQDHPLLGEWTSVGFFNNSLDSNAYDHHVIVYEMLAKPSMKYPKGRLAVYIDDGGDGQLEDLGDLVKSVTFTNEDGEAVTNSVEQVKFHLARWKTKFGEVFGQGLVSGMKSPQRMLNGAMSQVVQAREQFGSPSVIATDDMEFKAPEIESPLGGRLLQYTPSTMNPAAQPQIVGGTTFPPGVWQETNFLMEMVKHISTPPDIMRGEAPRNITTTSGLMYVGENAEQAQATRKGELKAAFKDACEHLLHLASVFQADPADYDYKTEEGKWDRKQYSRINIIPNAQVKVEQTAFVSQSLFRRESIREGQADGLYDISKPNVRRQIREERGLPSVDEEEDKQTDLAQRAWTDFYDEGRIPVVNPSLDDPQIWFLALRSMVWKDEAQELLRELKWAEAVRILAGWESDFVQLQQMAAMNKQLYGSAQDEAGEAEIYANLTAAWSDQTDAYKQMMQQAQAASLPMEQLGPPPQQPQPPLRLPEALQDQIVAVWQQKLQKKGFQAQVGDPGPERSFDELLQFMAVVDAYKILTMQNPSTFVPSSVAGGAPPPGAAPQTPTMPEGGAQGG